MLTKRLDAASVAVTPQNAQDLLALRRVIRAGDTISGSASWVLKQDREHARPDKGERVRVRMAVRAGTISLESGRLRVAGTVNESDLDSIPRGTRHSIWVVPGETVRITKGKWLAVDQRLLKSPAHRGFVLVAIDRAECCVARLYGTRLSLTPNIYSGQGGKRYRTSPDYTRRYMERAEQAIMSVLRDGDKLVVFGPGETKRVLANRPGVAPGRPVIAEGVDTGGEDGIHLFTRSDSMKTMMSDSGLARAASLLDEIMAMAGRGGAGFTMGFQETSRACRAGTVRALLFSQDLFEVADEEAAVGMLNDAERTGGRIYAVDSTTDVGLRVSGLGGVVSVLRYG